MKRSNLLVVKIAWILIQGLFLPLVLWLDGLRSSGQLWSALGLFVLLELLYLVDAWLFLRVFKTP